MLNDPKVLFDRLMQSIFSNMEAETHVVLSQIDGSSSTERQAIEAYGMDLKTRVERIREARNIFWAEWERYRT